MAPRNPLAALRVNARQRRENAARTAKLRDEMDSLFLAATEQPDAPTITDVAAAADVSRDTVYLGLYRARGRKTP